MPTYIKTCIECGKEYTAGQHNTKWCKDCVVIGRQKRDAECRKRRRNATKAHDKPKTTIYDVLAQLDRYNKEHNTNLSYGHFIQIKDGGI